MLCAKSLGRRPDGRASASRKQALLKPPALAPAKAMLRENGRKREAELMARALVRQYGDEAEVVAAGHADTMLDMGDVPAFETWKAVMAAIRGLQAVKAN